MMGSLGRFIALAAVVASGLAANAAFASSETTGVQPTLTGEELVGTPIITSAQCSPTGPSSFSYTVSGVATGPYPGLFTETGRVEMTSQTRGLVSSFSAGFSIVPAPGDPNPSFTRIDGAKTLLEPLSGEADCDSQGPGEVDRFSLFVTHRYAAVIRAGSQTCFDRGIGSIQMLILGGEVPLAEFREDFFSDFTFTTGRAVCGDDDDDEDDGDDGDDDD